MKKIIFVAALLAACQDPADMNRAVDYVKRINSAAECTSWGREHTGDYDVAVCTLDDILHYCVAGATREPSCKAVWDLDKRRREESQRRVQMPPASAPPAPVGPPIPPTLP